jgi:hypothetical protein
VSAGLELSSRAGIALFVWYAIVFAAGAYLLLRNIIYLDVTNADVDLQIALTSAVGAALASCSLYYVRRLYKDLFQSTSGEQPPSGRFVLASVIYFVSRPFFAALFAIIVVITTAALIHATTTHGTKLSAGFVFFTVLVSAYGAAVTGRVINHLENIGLDKIRSFGGLS